MSLRRRKWPARVEPAVALFIANAAEGDPGPWNVRCPDPGQHADRPTRGQRGQVALDQTPLRDILLGIATQVDRSAKTLVFILMIPPASWD